MQHAGQRDVVYIVAHAANEAIVFDTAASGSEATDLDFIDGHGASSSSTLSLARSKAAATSTDLTMF